MENVDTGAAVRMSEKWQAAVREGRVGGGAHKQLGNSDAVRQKISEGLRKYYSENKGKTYINTEKHRVSMAKAAGIAINKIENGIIIDTYDSIANAARSNNLAASTLKRAVVLSKELAGFSWQKVPKDVAQ